MVGLKKKGMQITIKSDILEMPVTPLSCSIECTDLVSGGLLLVMDLCSELGVMELPLHYIHGEMVRKASDRTRQKEMRSK